jgi:hypothetical protein
MDHSFLRVFIDGKIDIENERASVLTLTCWPPYKSQLLGVCFEEPNFFRGNRKPKSKAGALSSSLRSNPQPKPFPLPSENTSPPGTDFRLPVRESVAT